MIGACPWVIPASWHIPIIDTRERLRPKRLLTREELLDYDLEIRQAYHEIVDALLHPALPVLQNTDGDPLELTTLIYELGVTASEAVERLMPLATLRGDVHLADEVHDADGALLTSTLTWIKAGNRKHKDWDNTTLGTLRLDGSRLVVQVNSARRRRRIEKATAKCLGSVSDAGRHDGHRPGRGSREAARAAFSCATRPHDPSRFATIARSPCDRGRARTQALGGPRSTDTSLIAQDVRTTLELQRDCGASTSAAE